MTLRGAGSRQKDIIAVLEANGPTLDGPSIQRRVANLNGRDQVTDSLRKQLRKTLNALTNPDAQGNPPQLLKERRGSTNWYTLAVHSLTQEQLAAEEAQLAKAFQREAATSLLDNTDDARKRFLGAVALQTWRRVKCLAGESIDAASSAGDIGTYLVVRLGMSPDDLNNYIRAEATRILNGQPWTPLRLAR